MRHSLVMAAAIITLSGCTSFHLVRANEPVPLHATVAITFDEPRDLEARRETHVYSLPEVSTVYGEVEEVRSDTLVLRSIDLQSDRRQPQLPHEARLALVPGPSAQVSALQVSKWRTGGTVALSAVGLFFYFVSQMEW